MCVCVCANVRMNESRQECALKVNKSTRRARDFARSMPNDVSHFTHRDYLCIFSHPPPLPVDIYIYIYKHVCVCARGVAAYRHRIEQSMILQFAKSRSSCVDISARAQSGSARDEKKSAGFERRGVLGRSICAQEFCPPLICYYIHIYILVYIDAGLCLQNVGDATSQSILFRKCMKSRGYVYRYAMFYIHRFVGNMILNMMKWHILYRAWG